MESIDFKKLKCQLSVHETESHRQSGIRGSKVKKDRINERDLGDHLVKSFNLHFEKPRLRATDLQMSYKEYVI